MSETLEHIDIKKLLPHRAPMLMVDTILKLSSETVQTSFRVTPDCIFSNNDMKVLAEEGLVENMAQTASIIIGQSYIDPSKENNSEVIGFISSIKTLNILSDLPSNTSEIKTSAKVTSRMDGEGYTLCTVEGETSLNENIILNCTLNLFIKSL